MKLSRHFNRREFACKCGCGADTVDAELIQILEHTRLHFKRPITITSGVRCAEHNKRVGGSKNSLHITGRAADFKVQGVSSKDVYTFLADYLNKRGGLGLYSSWVHVDSRSNGPARWGNK